MFVVLCKKSNFQELIAQLARSSQAYGKNLALDKCGIAGRDVMANAFGQDVDKCVIKLHKLLGYKYK